MASQPNPSPHDWITTTALNRPFTILATGDTVVASGWTDDPEYLKALVHRSIRPTELSEVATMGSITDAVTAFDRGDLHAIEAVAVHQVTGGDQLRMAWDALRDITPGAPVSYTELATRIGRPNAPRVGAMACSRNAAALFVPCHRVLRSDGTLGGFRYGLEVKKDLIAHESTHAPA